VRVRQPARSYMNLPGRMREHLKITFRFMGTCAYLNDAEWALKDRPFRNDRSIEIWKQNSQIE
jgi:hypothetical protein